MTKRGGQLSWVACFAMCWLCLGGGKFGLKFGNGGCDGGSYWGRSLRSWDGETGVMGVVVRGGQLSWVACFAMCWLCLGGGKFGLKFGNGGCDGGSYWGRSLRSWDGETGVMGVVVR
ncbi:unnamed protein product [Ilex paraguariensis]|uniref:Uncharacterized protein n=1 Tax=Ilex paraguariensis TaxID=185542 RepID=A0ABC8UHW2_9AQUA